MILNRFADPALSAAALAQQVIGSLGQGLQQRGAASLAVPGGRTPLPLFEALRDAPLDWSRVAITLTDERWVPESDAGSNAALLRGALQGAAASAARFVPLHQEAATAQVAAQSVWDSLQSLPLPFDAVVLGMGEDGHFASLFPGNALLSRALDTQAAPGCVAMQAPAAPRSRLSLNLAALLQTRRLFLLVSGQAKLELLQQARAQEAGRWPVSALLAQQRLPVEIYWAP